MMIDAQQAVITAPAPAPTEAIGSEIVVLAQPVEEEPYRLKRSAPPETAAGFWQRPHVIKLAPNVSLGFQGDGKGVGLRATF